MSQAVTRSQAAESAAVSINETSGSDVFVFPVSFPQRRLWLLDQLVPGSCAYNIYSAWTLKGDLDIPALEKAFAGIISRHEILRTTFKAMDGEPVQIISEPKEFHLPEIDLRVLSVPEREKRIGQLIEEESLHAFDLEQGPLLRLTLVKVRDQEHVLIKNIHHILTDSWSEEIFVKEWISLYQSYSRGKSPVLAPLPIQYADFSEWQHQMLQGEEISRQLSYWRQKLEGAPSVLNLPSDRPRPAIPDYSGAEVSFAIPPGITHALKELSKRERVTLFVTLLTAFKLLLHRYSGQSDIVVGTPITNRSRSELEPLIGFFLNTLALRTTFAGNPGFIQALASVRDTALEGFEKQDVPFEMLVEKLQPERNLSQHPLCQVMFVLLRSEDQTWTSGNISATPIEVGDNSAKFDIVLSLSDKGETITGSFVYSKALFDQKTIERMAQSFQALLEAVTAEPARPIGELPLLSESERRKITGNWNDTAAPCSLAPVNDLVSAQCNRTPDAVAVTIDGEAITYGELERRSVKLAAHLQALGAGQGQFVGLCCGRSLDMIVALQAILRCGAGYVPLDPDFPRARLDIMIATAKPGIIVTQHAVADSLPKSDAKVVYLEDNLPGTADFQPVHVEPDDTAYVLFTSGSTGKPKGVEIPHKALTNLLESMQRCPGMTGSDVLLAVTTLSFDIAGLEIFLPLICGARIVMASREAAMDGRRLAAMIASEGITVMQATPATWRAVLAAEWSGSPNLKILCGGEAMTGDLAEQLLPLCASLWNMYGPTETTIWSTLQRVESAATPVSIGRPIANTTIYILNESGQVQPVGIYGELYIGGLGMAKGYLGQPELTAAKFVPDPFGKPGERLYRTGDLARYRDDGCIEFLGRMDHQVKVRGFRIELAEIESVLGRHEAVRQCVVSAREDRPGDKRLVAYVVKQGEIDEAKLREFVQGKLPDYMVPSLFVFLDKLPLTPNGKVDRKALPAPDVQFSRHREFLGPRNELEEKLAAIWSRVLGVESVSINDDFFELGGHSLMAVSLFTEIEKKLGRKLPLATLFEAPTIAQMAEVIQREGWTAPWSPLVPIQPKGRNTPFFCIHGADGAVLFYSKLASLLAPDQPVYGLQAQGLDGGEVRHSSTEAMAALYIKEVRSVQPKGPYYFGGYSFGGLLALEMAQQLRRQGEKVALVALFDTNNPLVPPRRYSLGERVAMRRRSVAGFGLWGKIAYVWDRGVRKLAVMGLLQRERIRRIAYRFTSQHHKIIPPNYRIIHVREANEEAMRNYKPQVYDGTLTLVRAENPNDGFEFDPELGWKGLATGGVEICDVPGEHETMFQEPHVHVLAETMKSCIRKARIRTGE